MSPALVKKYIDAARLVADHIVFKPKGFTFAPYPMVTVEDRDKYAVHRVVDFYKRQPLDYADYFRAAWRFRNRAALQRPDATLADFARDATVSPKYLKRFWTMLTSPGEDAGPIAAMQARWKNLPPPAGNEEPDSLRPAVGSLADFITNLRPCVAMSSTTFRRAGLRPARSRWCCGRIRNSRRIARRAPPAWRRWTCRTTRSPTRACSFRNLMRRARSTTTRSRVSAHCSPIASTSPSAAACF